VTAYLQTILEDGRSRRTRNILTTGQVKRLIDHAERARSNGSMLADLLKLLAYSGAREMEALRLRWRDVDFETQRLHIGRDGQTKNREPSVSKRPRIVS
jgi:integrase